MKCFVIMPFDKPFNDVYDVIKKAVAEQRTLQCGRIDEIKRPGSILDDLVDELESATVCIADLTGNRPNVLWEVGYAMALNKPMILVSQDLQSLPFDLAPNRTIEYDREDLAGTLGPRLTEALVALDESPPLDWCVRAWESISSSLEGEYSQSALSQALDLVVRATGQRHPRVRLWGNCRAMGAEHRDLFTRIGADIGNYCAAKRLPIIGSSADDRTLEVAALDGVSQCLRSHPSEDGLEFFVHFSARGDGSRPDFVGALGSLPSSLRITYVEYPYRAGKRLQRVRTVVKSERDNEHDARFGSLLQADLVVLLGAGDSAHNMLEMVASIENLRLRAAPPLFLLPLPWCPGMGRVAHKEFRGSVNWRLLGRVEDHVDVLHL